MSISEIDTESSKKTDQAEFLDTAKEYAPYYLAKLSIILQNWFKLITLRPRTPPFDYDQKTFSSYNHPLKKNKIYTQVNLIDDEIELHANGKIYTFPTRIIESKSEHGKGKLRLVLWSCLGNLETRNQDKSSKKPWTPLCKEERAAAPLEVLKSYTSRFGPFSSILTSSMGTSLFDGLPLLEKEEFSLIPKTLIISRGMPSVEKYLTKKYPWTGQILASIASHLGLAMDGEKALIEFLKRAYSQTSPLLSRKKVIVIEMSNDTLFSKEGAFDADFGETINEYADLFRGKFTLPTEPNGIHHYAPIDQIKKYQGLEGCQTEKFLKMKNLESIPQVLARHTFNEVDQTNWHTSLFVGGRGSTLDTMTQNYAFPIMEAFINNQNETLGSEK